MKSRYPFMYHVQVVSSDHLIKNTFSVAYCIFSLSEFQPNVMLMNIQIYEISISLLQSVKTIKLRFDSKADV